MEVPPDALFKEVKGLQRLYFVSEVFCDQIEQRCAQFDDLLVGETLALQLPVEAFGHRFVSVQIQFFRVLVSHFLYRFWSMGLKNTRRYIASAVPGIKVQ